jgi:acetyl esterase
VPLDDDAEQMLDLMAQAFPAGLGGVSVEEAREAMGASQAAMPPAPEVHAVDDLTVAGPNGEVPVRVYRPSGASDLPVLVWLHGGAFALGELDHYDRTCSELALACEAVVVSVDYRLAPEHQFPAGVEDAYAAATWVVEHAAEIGGDPACVAIGGDSAGGTLAAAVTLMARDRSGPVFVHQLLVYPTVLLRVSNAEHSGMPFLDAATCEIYWQHYVRTSADRTSPYCAPMNESDLTGLPPAFVLTAEVDPTRDDAERYATRLAEAGVRTALKRYHGSFHGFFTMAFALGCARVAFADATAELRGAFAAAKLAAQTPAPALTA